MAFVLLGFTSIACSSDKDEEPAGANIIGSWKCISESQSSETLESSNDFVKGEVIQFLEGGRCLLPWDEVSDPMDEWSSWSLKEDNLTIMESDLDRWIGKIKINGNEMTFTYKYQNWNYDSGTMTEEDPITYISVFSKQ